MGTTIFDEPGRLRILRKNLGCTLAAAAAALGCSVAHLCNVERGRVSDPALARAYGQFLELTALQLTRARPER